MENWAAPIKAAKEDLIRLMILQPIHGRLSAINCAMILMDYQPSFALAINSTDRNLLIRNGVNLAKIAKTFSIPTVLATIGQSSFGGPLFSKLQEIFPDKEPIDRSDLSVFEDTRVLTAMEKIGRNKLVIAGLWTDFGVAASIEHAQQLGYEVFMVVDACGDVTLGAHQIATQRLCREGAVPMTWLQMLLALHRDWAPPEAYDVLFNIAKNHASVYGLEIRYAQRGLDEGQTRLENDKPREKKPRLENNYSLGSRKVLEEV
jgi:nicotinamidase-related amidase